MAEHFFEQNSLLSEQNNEREQDQKVFLRTKPPNTSSEQNLYPDILKIADYMIVTSDSVNMISETATSSTPLFVSYLSKETGKISSFLNNLEKLGILKHFEGKLFNYKKIKLNTNKETILKVNKFLGFQNIT